MKQAGSLSTAAAGSEPRRSSGTGDERDLGARLARRLFRLYPDGTGARYADEAWRTFLDLRRERRAEGGAAAVAGLWARVIAGAFTRGLGDRLGGLGRGLPPTLRQGVRGLVRRPAFSATVILILGLGIGTNAAVFSVVDTILVESIPFPDADRLVLVEGHQPADASQRMPMSYLDLRDLAERSTTLEAIATRTLARSFNITSGQEPEHVDGELVGHAFFDLLGLEAAAGRFLEPVHEEPGEQLYAVLGHDLWQRRFGGDPGAVGSTIEIDARLYEVIGVAPPGFRGLSDEAEVWMPIPMAASIYANFYVEVRAFRWLAGLAKLAPGATVEQANAELDQLTAALAEEFPETSAGDRAHVTPLADTYFGDMSRNVVMLWAAAGFVLLVSCANVASLLLTGTLARWREIALRRALGARRSRLLHELLAESLVLALAGGLVGIVAAVLANGLIERLLAHALPSFVTVDIDATVVAAMLVLAGATALLATAAPALAMLRASSRGVLGQGSRASGAGLSGLGRGSGRRFNLHSALLLAEVALAVALCVGGALTVKGFQALLSQDLGLRTDNVLTARLDVQDERFDELAPYQQLVLDLSAEVGALPEVDAVALSGPRMPVGAWNSATLSVEDRVNAGLDERGIDMVAHRVTPDYFRTLGIPMLLGRDFSEADRGGQGAPFVVAVSQGTAEGLWPGENPLGKRVKFGGPESEAPWMEVVGVVGDVEYAGFGTPPPIDLDIYFPLLQLPARTPPLLNLLIRTDADPDTLLPSLRATAQRLAPASPLFDARTLASRLEEQASPRRAVTTLMGVFAVLALALAAGGVYAVIAHTVTQQRQEMGIRLAMGARSVDLFGFVLGRALALAALGIGVGLALAWAGARLIGDWLHGVPPTDPASYIVASLAVLAMAGVAAALPARRAARVSPVTSLRQGS